MVKEDLITPINKDYFDATNSEPTSVGYGMGRAMKGKIQF